MSSKSSSPLLVSLNKIWDQSEHCAFTDLIHFNNQWFCVFRESDQHEGTNGVIRIISSKEAVIWTSIELLEIESLDLRDPKLSITSEGKLMLNFCAVRRDHEGNQKWWQSLATFSRNGIDWSPISEILPRNEWLWRVTWNKGMAYGVSYRVSDMTDLYKEWYVSLWESGNGIDFQHLVRWDIPGRPNETTIRFTSTGDAIALMRNNRKPHRKSWIGKSSPPYTDWIWQESLNYFSCPDFLILPDNTIFAAGRMIYPCPYTFNIRVILATVKDVNIKPILLLPSQGDCGYPGMVYDKGFIWISYYSSIENTSAIYLAKVYI